MAGLDKLTEKLARSVARGTSRRSMLAAIGGAITGAAVHPSPARVSKTRVIRRNAITGVTAQ